MLQKATHLIVDTNALFLKGKEELLTYCLDGNLYTTLDVIEELRDKKTRENVENSLIDIKVKNPSTESIKQISEFAKKTGDYASLSVADIRVLALTLDIEKAQNGHDHLRSSPLEVVTQVGGKREDETKLGEGEGWFDPSEKVDEVNELAGKVQLLSTEHSENVGVVEEIDDKCNDGWITPSNIKSMTHSLKTKSSAIKAVDEKELKVACMTSDFAMQNVLLQIGCNVLSADGMRIKRIKNWVLRCHACYNITRNMEKRFCDKCGGPTLIRTSMSVDPETGKMILYLKRNFQYRVRGTKYSIPDAKGGRVNNMILREDQKEYSRAVFSEKKAKEKALKGSLDRDGMEFGVGQRFDIPSVVIGYGRKNPNEARKSVHKKKKQ